MNSLSTASHLSSAISAVPSVTARGLTRDSVIDAISASADWFEKNTTYPVPTPAEMTSLLEEHRRSKETPAIQHDAVTSPITRRTQRGSVTPEPTSDFVYDAPSPSQTPNEHSHIGQNTSPAIEDADRATTTSSPQTPARQQQPDTPRGWASALSASAIGNIFRTPVGWFSRRERARQNPSATAPRASQRQAALPQSAQPQQKYNSTNRPNHGNKTMPAKTRSSSAYMAGALPATPTPASRQIRRGRPDAHLPVHLRGVLYEDLPPDWQAQSQHMKKPEPIAEEEEAPVDFPALLREAERYRALRDQQEAMEKAERLAREQEAENEDIEDGDARTGDKRKRTVTIKQKKVFSAKLGPSTFGVPLNIDDDSSDEEIEVEVDLSEKTKRETRSPNTSSPKSSLRDSAQEGVRSPRRPREDNWEQAERRRNRIMDLEYHAYCARKFGKKNHEENPLMFSVPRDEFNRRYQHHKVHDFLKMPPKEFMALEKARKEWVEVHEMMQPSEGERKQMNDIEEFFRRDKIRGDMDRIYPLENPFAPDTWGTDKRTESPRSKDIYDGDENADGPSTPQNRNEEHKSGDSELTPLQETKNDRLNKVREQALKHKPKVPSGLSQTQIMSPMASMASLASMADKQSPFGSLGEYTWDEEVLAAIMAIPEADIVAENFGPIMALKEGTVSREATKALEL
jgi:hypothetical protein